MWSILSQTFIVGEGVLFILLSWNINCSLMTDAVSPLSTSAYWGRLERHLTQAMIKKAKKPIPPLVPIMVLHNVLCNLKSGWLIEALMPVKERRESERQI